MITNTALEYPRVFIAGHRGLVGSAVLRKIPDAVTRTREQLDLASAPAVDKFFRTERPGAVVLAAAAVGGIQHNIDRPADMIFSNLQIQCNVIDACGRYGAVLVFLGSSCIYPLSTHPLAETDIMTGRLEPTNSAYAMAKLAGIEMCKAYAKQYGLRYVALMPCNLYGPNGFSGSQATHVLPTLMLRFHNAKVMNHTSVTIWGDGSPLREFMHSDDIGEAARHFLYSDVESGVVNVGSSEEVSISGLANMVAETVGYKGEIRCDPTKPNGAPRKLMNSSKARAMGWFPKISLRDGLRSTYEWLKGTL